jgi:hypothetical protein
MTVAAVTSKTVYNLNTTVSTLTIPFTMASTANVAVFVSIPSDEVTVASVTDNSSASANVWTWRCAGLAKNEIDYSTGHYIKAPIYNDWIEGECWTTPGGTSATSITVTLTGPSKFAVALQSYTATTGLASSTVAWATTLVNTTTPTVTVANLTSASTLLAAFMSAEGLNQTVLTGTSRSFVSEETENGTGMEIAVADSTLTANAATIAFTPTPVIPATYVVCTVEVKT